MERDSRVYRARAFAFIAMLAAIVTPSALGAQSGTPESRHLQHGDHPHHPPHHPPGPTPPGPTPPGPTPPGPTPPAPTTEPAAPATQLAAPIAKKKPPCTPFEPRSSKVEYDRLDGLPRVTEYLDGGAYRITACNRQGNPLVMFEAAPYRIPGIGVRHMPRMKIEAKGAYLLRRTIEYPPFKRSNARTVRRLLRMLPPPADLSRVKKSTKKAAKEGNPEAKASNFNASAAGYVVRRGQKDLGCTTYRFTAGASHWEHPFTYYFHDDPAIPPSWINAIVTGHEMWNQSVSPCKNIVPQIKALAVYGGGGGPPASLVADGVNSVDFGPVEDLGCIAALACTVNFTLATSPSVTVESDMRFDNKKRWSPTGKARRYDLVSVAAHESGHSIVGLADLYSPKDQWLTMHGYVDIGRIRKRTLAAGDINGLRAVFP